MVRKINNQLAESLSTLHEILLLVENDEVSYKNGCHWDNVKRNIKTVKIKSDSDQVIITSLNGDFILKMKRSKRIASDFIINFRNAFAHNQITYNPKTTHLSVDLKSKTGSISLLNGEIALSTLREIIELIKISKNQKKK